MIIRNKAGKEDKNAGAGKAGLSFVTGWSGKALLRS